MDKPAPKQIYGNLKPVQPDTERCDVMRGPECTFTPQDPEGNKPKVVLQRPGNLGMGTSMG